MRLSYEKIIFHLPTGILIIFKVMVVSDYSILHLSTGVKIKFMHVYIETVRRKSRLFKGKIILISYKGTSYITNWKCRLHPPTDFLAQQSFSVVLQIKKCIY